MGGRLGPLFDCYSGRLVAVNLRTANRHVQEQVMIARRPNVPTSSQALVAGLIVLLIAPGCGSDSPADKKGQVASAMQASMVGDLMTLHQASIDLQAAARAAGVEATIVLEGDGAVVVGDDRLQGSWLRGVDGLGGTEELAPGLRFVSAEPGRWFAPAAAEVELKGVHGGLATRTQVAIVAGGHAAVPRLAAGLARRVPEAPDWAVTIAELLDLDLPTATGRSLLA